MKSFLLLPVLALCVSATAFAASAKISKADLEFDWPLTVDAGVLTCEPLPGNAKLQLVTFTTNGKTYALNGIAKGHVKSRGWGEIGPIWKENASVPGTKMGIGPLITRGISLCK